MTAPPAARSAAPITALMTGASYATSAEMAGDRFGAFPGFAENREAMLRVIRNHRRAAHGAHGPSARRLPGSARGGGGVGRGSLAGGSLRDPLPRKWGRA